MTTLNKQPEGIAPGVYYDLPNEEYHADPALSSSGLKSLLKNPMEYWSNSCLNPDREPLDTVALKNGRAAHMLLLEPQNFDNEFVIKKGIKQSKVEGVIGEGDYEDMLKAVKVIKSHPTLSKLIEGGNPEVSIFWKDEETGIMCRCRFDYLLPRIGFDYKRTTDVYSKEKLGYAISDYGYDISAPMYIEGLKNVGLYDEKTHLGFVLLFQMGKPPFVPRALRLDDRIMATGHSKFRLGLQLYKEHIDKYGSSPWSSGYDGVEDILLEEMPYRYKQ